jgi:hypothetical protein
MSTKSTIRYEDDKASQQGFHLYDDIFDEDNVYLELLGFQFESSTSVGLSGGGVPSLTVKLPRAWAQKLGLITLPGNEPSTGKEPSAFV